MSCSWIARVAALLLLTACVSTPASPDQIDPDRDPTSRTLHSLARLHASAGRHDIAVAVYEELLAGHPRDVPAYAELAAVHMRTDHIERARNALRRGLAVAPRDAVLLNDLGVCHLAARRTSEAYQAFEAAAASAPHDARPVANMALTLALMGRQDEALATWERVLMTRDARHNLDVITAAATTP